VIKNVMGVLPQALEITFEVQRKMSNKKITRKKKKPFQLIVFFFFPLFGPLLLLNLVTFLFISNDLKCYRSVLKVLQIILEL
jgi:hypothetical protein